MAAYIPVNVIAPLHKIAVSGTISLTNSGTVSLNSDNTYTIDSRDLTQAYQLGCYNQPANCVQSAGASGPANLMPNAVVAAEVSKAGLLGKIIGANLNTTGDNRIPITGGASYVIRTIRITNASVSLTAAYGGVYTAASKGGTALVAQAALSGLTASTVYQDLTLQNNTAVLSTSPLYLSCGTVQGTAATADIYIYGDVLA